MKAPGFKRWFARLPALNGPQRLLVLHALRPAAGLAQIIALIEQARSADRRCPRCHGAHWHRHGHANNLQRYRCRACGRTFNDLSGTPLARLRLREKWIDYLEAMLASRPVRAAADHAGVHRNTAFRWHHRFLRRVKDDRPQRLCGIVEADEMFMRESQKDRASSTGRRASGVARQAGAAFRANSTAYWSHATAQARRSMPSRDAGR